MVIMIPQCVNENGFYLFLFIFSVPIKLLYFIFYILYFGLDYHSFVFLFNISITFSFYTLFLLL